MRSTGPKQAPEHFNGRMLSHEAALGPFTTAACWHDLLGFSAKLEEAGWTLEGPSATLLVKRLHNLYVSLTQFGSPHEQLALNDGVIATFSPDLYEEKGGSRHDLVMWLQNCLQVHCVTTGLENDFQLPGLRTIICEGQIIVHRTGADPVRMNYPGHMYPLSTQLNTAFAKCFLADQAGSRAGLKRGSVYIETAILRSLRDRFGCKQFGNFLFLYGTALLDPPERYVELTDFYQQQEDEWRNTGLLEDRSSWLQLGDTVQVQHKSLTIELTDVLAFSPFDESALFWFDTLTGDMHGITDGSCIQLDWHLNPLHPNPPIRESESKIFYDFTKAYRAFIEQNGGTHLRRDTFIPQRFQASKAAAASDGHAVHF